MWKRGKTLEAFLGSALSFFLWQVVFLLSQNDGI